MEVIKVACKYKMSHPEGKILCEAYHKSERSDGLNWCHFPICSDENCPLKHPELLEGAILKKEE